MRLLELHSWLAFQPADAHMQHMHMLHSLGEVMGLELNATNNTQQQSIIVLVRLDVSVLTP